MVTIEDPIEFIHRDDKSIINQREVGTDTASFARALRRVLRQDPDVILIGEIRDAESAQMALSAAETGHLVLSTLHTVDATETINRLIDLFPTHERNQVRTMIAGTLKGIIGQRLVRTKSGYRTPACEVMVTTGRIRDFIMDPAQIGQIEQAISEGEYYGMQTFDQALLKLVEEDRVDYEEAIRISSRPQDFKLMVYFTRPFHGRVSRTASISTLRLRLRLSARRFAPCRHVSKLSESLATSIEPDRRQQ